MYCVRNNWRVYVFNAQRYTFASNFQTKELSFCRGGFIIDQ